MQVSVIVECFRDCRVCMESTSVVVNRVVEDLDETDVSSAIWQQQQRGGTLYLTSVYSCSCSCCLHKIFIKTLTGRKQALNFEPENQVLAVKQALQEKEGIQVDQIKLIYSGKQLADDKTLESYGIAAGATIHMVLQLRGGAGQGGGVVVVGVVPRGVC